MMCFLRTRPQSGSPDCHSVRGRGRFHPIGPGFLQARHLTHSQFERFLDAVRAPPARLYALIGLYTMARPTAILELTWDRIDFVRGLVDFNPDGRRQTQKRRPVVFENQPLRDALQEV